MRHFRAPQGDGEALIEPGLSQAHAAFSANSELLNQGSTVTKNVFIFGTSLYHWRTIARFELVSSASNYSSAYRGIDLPWRVPEAGVVMSGHQPELFHPGVWLKNYVLHQLGQRLQIVPINLTVDNDTAGTATIRFPAGSPSQPRFDELAIDEPFENVPFEERPIVASSNVRQFAARLRKQFDPADWFEQGRSPALLADDLAQHVERPQRGKSDRPLGETLARARHRLEADFGLQTLELPLSQVAQRQTFRSFAAFLLRELPVLHDIYNRSLTEYRVVNKIRSSSHPVPALAVDGEWLEAPFWIWSTTKPFRKRLFVRRRLTPQGDFDCELTDRESIQLQFHSSANDISIHDEQLQQFESSGIKIRPRALITTMYARLFLSDLFIHGIGGAKYDELTDAIIRRFFGIEPPAYMTVTGTVRLPIPRPSTTAEDVRNVKQLLRELRFHPEKFVNDASPAIRENATQFAEKKKELLRQHQFHFRGASKEEFRALDDLNRQLSLLLTDVEIRLRDELREREAEAARNKLLGSREFSFVLHPADTLPEQLKKMASHS